MSHRGLHELNTTFSWRRPEGPFIRLSEDQVDCYDRDGYLIVPDAFDAAQIRAVTSEIDQVEARLSAVLSRRDDLPVPPTEFTIAANLALRSPALRAFCRSGVLAEIAFDLVGSAPRLYWDQAVYKKPRSSRNFAWHQDNGSVFVDPQQYITCWIALTDATEENGCPVVARGLHTQGTLRHWAGPEGLTCFEGPVDTVALPLKAGSVAVFSSVTTHMTSGNSTNETRKGYVVQYMADGSVTRTRMADGSLVDGALDTEERNPLVLAANRTARALTT